MTGLGLRFPGQNAATVVEQSKINLLFSKIDVRFH